MKQIYYTQEGAPYYLVSATKLIPNIVVPVVTGLNPRISFNFPPPLVNPNSLDSIFITNDKKIIPLLMFYNIVNTAVGVPVLNCAMPYFAVINEGTGVAITNVNFLKSLTKNMANIETIFKEIPEPAFPLKPLNDKYGIKYNQCVYSEKDFIQLENETVVPFRTISNEITVGVPTVQGTLLAGSYAISQSFIYFELIK